MAKTTSHDASARRTIPAGGRAIVVALGLLIAGWHPVPAGAAQAIPTPPPEPAVRPQIPDVGTIDADGNRMDDGLDETIRTLQNALTGTVAPSEAARLTAQLDEPVAIELVFSEQITQAELDAFVGLGGTIDHV